MAFLVRMALKANKLRNHRKKKAFVFFSTFNGTFFLLFKQEACNFIFQWALQMTTSILFLWNYPTFLSQRAGCGVR